MAEEARGRDGESNSPVGGTGKSEEGGKKMLKIVTYNVNGLRQRISQFGSLLNLLNSLDADIICFQEIKLTRQELTTDLAMAEGYESFFSITRTSGKGRTGYSGVATFCRVNSTFSSVEAALPITAEEGLTGLLDNSGSSDSSSGQTFGDDHYLMEFKRDELLTIDSEGRCMITDHGHFVLFNIYGPRADSDDADRIQFKANFYKILQKRWDLLQGQGRRIVVVGDLNIAPAAIDRCDARPDFEKNEFRRWFRALLVKNGGSFHDIFRDMHPERKDAYTCWPVHTGAEEFNYGSRIDHILACGLCLHEVHDQEGHNLMACHVKDCDIMTQFGRWKPGITPRWKGGRITKLEGSDHVPVYVVFKDIPDIPAHNTPSLSSRYMPEIRGFQQTIVSILMKRKVTEQFSVSWMGSIPASDQDQTKKLTVCESMKGTYHDFSISSAQSEELASFQVDAKEDDMRKSNSGEYVAIGRHGCLKSIPNAEKNRTAKRVQPSQLSLNSFFQKVPNLTNAGSDCTKDDKFYNEIDVAMSYDEPSTKTSKLDGISRTTEKSDFNILVAAKEQESASVPTGEDKKHAALLEWQRIQQLMQDSIPRCDGHQEPCVSRVVKKQGPNFGRRFYVCARAEGPASNPETRCDFFRWAASKSKNR
ncbi:hypothetical protein Dimus_014093 [Dionaea muscipula]